MSCNDVASVLDTHRTARLAPAERAKIDAHLAACADCSAAWHAQGELLALRVPATPAALLERALLASRLPQSAQPRRARLAAVIGSAIFAGVAAAAPASSAVPMITGKRALRDGALWGRREASRARSSKAAGIGGTRSASRSSCARQAAAQSEQLSRCSSTCARSAGVRRVLR